MLLALTSLTAWFVVASPAMGATGAAGHFCLVLDTPATITNVSQTARRNSYVVLQPWEAQRASELKASDPSLSVLVYQNMSAIAQTPGPGGRSSSGVGYAEANNEHSQWFLTDLTDKRIAESSYPWLWMSDIGNASYQQKWTANVLRMLETGPWDGVLMDGVDTTAKYDVGPGRQIASYPTDASYKRRFAQCLPTPDLGSREPASWQSQTWARGTNTPKSSRDGSHL